MLMYYTYIHMHTHIYIYNIIIIFYIDIYVKHLHMNLHSTLYLKKFLSPSIIKFYSPFKITVIVCFVLTNIPTGIKMYQRHDRVFLILAKKT